MILVLILNGSAFKHDDRIDGDRLHLGIELERPFESTGYFIRPGARLTHTEYDLNRKRGIDDKQSRVYPVHIRCWTIFERDRKLLETFKPRATAILFTYPVSQSR